MVDELIQKIAEKSDLDESDIRDEVENKADEFAGLVSEEGAAHLVAREHGVQLANDADKDLTVENVVPGMNRVNLKAKIVDITQLNTFETDDGEGQVRNLVLGDQTGTLRMSLWNDQVELADKVEQGDVIQINNAYSREDNRGNPELRIGDSTKIKRVDEDIGDIQTQSSSSGGNYQHTEVNQIIDEGSNYEISGTVVAVYADNPFYQVCPDCDTTLKKDNDYECPDHGDVEPDYRLALTAIVDDGFGNIRCVFFQERAKKLLRAEDEEFQGNSQKVQDHAKKALGTNVIVRGRSQTNDFFNATELIVNELERADPESQIKHTIKAIQQ